MSQFSLLAVPIATAALSALSAMVCHAETAVTACPIRPGQSAAFLGTPSQLGINLHAGARLFFGNLNKQASILERTIEIVTAANKYKLGLTAENTRRLIQTVQGFASFGLIGTPTSNAALPIFNRAKVPFLLPLTSALSLREPFARRLFHILAG